MKRSLRDKAYEKKLRGLLVSPASYIF